MPVLQAFSYCLVYSYESVKGQIIALRGGSDKDNVCYIWYDALNDIVVMPKIA